jgi:hypothetical protein
MTRAISISLLGLVSFTLSGCLCWFVPCDRSNHVSGHVRTASGQPIEGAEVEFYGVTEKTDASGCFAFGGTLAASGFRVEARKPGYKVFSEGRKFDLYDLDVILEDERSPLKSRATWRVLSRDEAEETGECGR